MSTSKICFQRIKNILIEVQTERPNHFTFEEKFRESPKGKILQKLEFYYHKNETTRIKFGWVTNPEKLKPRDDGGTFYISNDPKYLLHILSNISKFSENLSLKEDEAFAEKFLHFTRSKKITWNYGKHFDSATNEKYQHLKKFIKWMMDQADRLI